VAVTGGSWEVAGLNAILKTCLFGPAEGQLCVGSRLLGGCSPLVLSGVS